MALLGLILGVAALVVSMAVMSGFESTLKQAMADVTGHAQVIKRSRFPDDWQELEARIRTAEPTLVSSSRFVFIEAVVAREGNVSGVLIQGVDSERMNQVLNFRARVISGSDDMSEPTDIPFGLIGKDLAKRMNLKVGDTFKVVVPIAESSDPSSFKRRMGEFRVQGILDLGKYEWNERFIITDLAAAQKIAEIGDRYSGLILKFQDIDYARKAAFHLSQVLGAPYLVRDWRDSSENLFEAVMVERPAIFMVISIIIFVAAFNISSTLFVNVVQRFKDIAILKTVGLSRLDVIKIFTLQGLFLGLVGVIGGFGLGFILSLLFSYAQSRLGLVSGGVYRIDGIEPNIRLVDSLAIVIVTLGICFVATLAPARRGGRLSPMEGLRNE